MISRSRVLAMLATAAAGSSLEPAGAQNGPDKLVVAGVPTEDATNMYWAVKTGFFLKAGLDVEMVNTSSGAAATTAMIAGTYQIARPSLFAVMLAHVRGIDVRCISAANLHDARNPMALLQVASDAAIRSGSDLNGKTIGIPALNDLNTVAVRAWIDKNGGDWRSLKFVEMPNSAMVPAMQAHRIDAAILQSPFIWTSLAEGSTRTLGDAWGAIAPRFLSGVNASRADCLGGQFKLYQPRALQNVPARA
jgi:NitT/TauT family transport system substrate-binding protein